MDFKIEEAKRENIWVKIALMGASGSGKTYSALRMATGMLEELKKRGMEKNGRIAFVNTEGARGRYYADEFKYDIADMEPPYTPEKYIEYINEIVKANYPILILDSTSHEWEGKGGALEIHQVAGGRWQDWAKVTPRHDKFILAIADSPIHIIATMRGKDQYVMEQEGTSKAAVKKLGVGAKQRDGFEYEFTSTFLIDQSNNFAVAQKDNTHLFETRGYLKISEDDGKELIDWANSGKAEYIPPKRYQETINEIEEMHIEESPELLETQEMIITLAKLLGGQKNKDLMTIMRKYIPSGNPQKITDVDTAKALYAELEQLLELEDKE